MIDKYQMNRFISDVINGHFDLLEENLDSETYAVHLQASMIHSLRRLVDLIGLERVAKQVEGIIEIEKEDLKYIEEQKNKTNVIEFPGPKDRK